MSNEYEIDALRRPQAVADLGREMSALFHNFGADLTRKNNLCMIENGVLMYALGNTVVIEDVVAGTSKTVLGLDEGGVGCVAAHPSKKMFAVGGRGFQPNIYIYSYPELVIINVLKGGAERGYSCLSYNAHGTKLASVASNPDYMLTVWDWKQELIELHSKAFGQDIFGVKFSKDDDARLTTCGTGHIRFWKMASTFTGLKLQGNIGKFGKVELTDVTAMEELPDGKVVSGTESGALLLWEGNFIKCRFVQLGGKPCHVGNVTYIELDRSEKMLVTAAEDGMIRWWDFGAIDTAEVDTDITMDFELLCVAEYQVDADIKIRSMLDCGADGLSRTLIINDSFGRTLSVKFPLVEPIEEYDEGEDRNTMIKKGLFKGSLSKSVLSFSESGDKGNHPCKPEVKTLSEYHSGKITGMDVSPDAHLAATCGVDGVVRVWDYVNKKLMCSRRFDAAATSLSWVPPSLNHDNDKDAKHVLVGFADGISRVLVVAADDDKVTLRQKFVFKPHNAAIVDLKFSDDASVLATSSKDGTIFLLKTAKIPAGSGRYPWAPIRLLVVHRGGNPKAPTVAESISWRPDGNALLLSCTDGVLREVDIASAYGLEDDCDTYEHEFPAKEFLGQVVKSVEKKVVEVKEAKEADDDSVSAAPASPKAGETVDAEVQYSTVKVTRAIYKDFSGKFLAGVTSAAHRMHLLEYSSIDTTKAPQDPDCELSMGLYSFDGKASLKNPLPTAIAFSGTRQFIGVGAADGSVCVRPTSFASTFLRIAAHNGAVSFVRASYDNKYILSAGADGVLAVHTINLELVTATAESLWRDLDAGVFGDETVKLDVKKEVIAPGVAAEPSPRAKKLPSLPKAPEDAREIEKGAYSIQDAKLKSEEDAKVRIAEEIKDQQRALVKALQREYDQIMESNNALPADVRLSAEQMTIDSEIFGLLKEKGNAMLTEVHSECEREAERAAKLRDKVILLQDSMLVEEVTLTAFHAGVGRAGHNFVRSIRTMGLPTELVNLLAEAQVFIKESVVHENVHKNSNDNQTHELRAVNMQGLFEESSTSVVSKSGVKEIEEDKHAASAAARREARRIRKENILKHKKEEPKDDEDDERDVNAIDRATRTIGDYQLKVSPAYVVPADQHVDAVKKRLQMVLLEESMVRMRLEFNERFFALRDLKKELVYAVQRANARIRVVDAELQQEHMSKDLWEPVLNPAEYPEDRDQVLEAELEAYTEKRKKTLNTKGGWLKTAAVDHTSINVSKQRLVNKNYATGAYIIEAVPMGLSSFKDLDISIANMDAMLALPESTELPKNYEVNDAPLQVYIRDSELNDVQRVKYVESVVPALARIQQVKRAVTRSEAVDDAVRNERRRRLRVEREWLTSTIISNVKAFAEAISSMRLDRTSCMADLKLAELKLLVLFQEFTILQGFESRDKSMLDKLQRSKKELASIELEVSDQQATLETKENDKKALLAEGENIVNGFASVLPTSHPYFEQLRRIYRMKIKRATGTADEGEEEEEEEEDGGDDEELEEDLDEVDDACPPGCDPSMYERIVEARDRKLDNDEATSSLQKQIDDTKRAYERLKTRLKQVSKDVKQAGTEIQAFQLQKQASLNQIDISIPLSTKQLYMFEASGALTGPEKVIEPESGDAAATGAPSEEKKAAEDEEVVDLSRLNDVYKRTLVSKIGVTDFCIVQADTLKALRARIGGLRKETEEARVAYGELRKERVALSRLRDAQLEKISMWKAKSRDLQMLKFGREVDLDDLEAGSNRTREDEAERGLKAQEDAYQETVWKLTKEGEVLRERLAKVMVNNTQLLRTVGDFSEMKLNITRDLNKPGNNVSTESKDEGRSEREERQKVIAYVQLQAREIEALRAELIMLKRKEAPQMSQIIGQQTAARPPGVPMGSQSQSQLFEGQLPPIPGANGQLSMNRTNQK